jgi:hypothetical protein
LSALRFVIGAIVVLALVAAGSASAAVLIGSKQIKDGSLTGVDLKRGTVRSSDVRDGSLKRRDFGVVPKGPTGLPGATGDRGISGSPGVTIVDLPLDPTTVVPGNSTASYTIPCMAPQKAVFGGSDVSTSMQMVQSAPELDGSAWDFVIRNNVAANQQPNRLYAVCVTDR